MIDFRRFGQQQQRRFDTSFPSTRRIVTKTITSSFRVAVAICGEAESIVVYRHQGKVLLKRLEM